MVTQAFILMDTTQKDLATAEDNMDRRLGARVIDNPLANALGLGTLVGKWVAPARILNDLPLYAEYVPIMENWPIYVFDSETLFVPDEV